MRLKLHNIANLALGLIAAISLPSCLQSETTVSVKKDGSGTITQETFLTAAALDMMKQFAQEGQPDQVAEMFSEEKAKEMASTLGEGVEFVKAEMINEEGKRGARYHFKFADINKVVVDPSSSMKSMDPDQAGGEAEKDPKETLRFSFADGKLKLLTPPAKFNEMKMEGMDLEGEQGAMAKQMMADMRMSVKIAFPDGIAESNATHTDGNTVTIFDVKMAKMLDQSKKLTEIAELAEKDMDAAKAAFNKLDGIKVETKEDVVITIK